MKFITAPALIFCAATLAVANPTQSSSYQVPLAETKANDNNMAAAIKDAIPGHNDATYGSIPKEDQAFEIEFLEIAPTPILAYVLGCFAVR